MDIQTVERIERELAQIDHQIDELRRKREAVLQQDKEYASYVEQYRVSFRDEPLPIRSYYQLAAELESINSEFQHPGADTHALTGKHLSRLLYLERVLAA